MMKDKIFDTLITNVLVYDGSGEKAFTTDIGITGDTFTALGNLEKKADVIIDGTGLVAAPGFIDIHTHDEYDAIQKPEMDFKIMQGVTTCIVCNCGFGVAPYEAAMNYSITVTEDNTIKWNGNKGYLQYLENNPASVNIGLMVGHNTLHSATVGNGINSKASTADIIKMQEYLKEGLDAGAFGLSFGLFYVPGCYSSTEELISLLEVCKGRNVLFSIHLRSEDDDFIEAVNEAVRIAKETGIPIQISHFKVVGKKNWNKLDEALEIIHREAKNGMNISLDQYPYSSGSTSLKEMARSGVFAGKGSDLKYSQALLASSRLYPEFIGMDIETIAEQLQMTPDKTIAKLTETDGPIAVFLDIINEDLIKKVMTDPLTMIGSDGVPGKGNPHPRRYGTFPRVLGKYVRDEKVLSLETAINKMTFMSAEKFSIIKRGLIKDGYFADLVIFDKNKISAELDYRNSKIYPKGIVDVFVNGIRTVENGKHTSGRAGKVIRRA